MGMVLEAVAPTDALQKHWQSLEVVWSNLFWRIFLQTI